MFAQLFQILLFAYELIVWQLELPPFCSHNKGIKLGIASHNGYILTSWVNSFPHLIAAICLNSDSWNHSISFIGMILFCLYLTLFMTMQCIYWWFPYLLNTKSIWHSSEEKMKRYELLFGDSLKILPKLSSPIVPSLEHSILFPLTVLTFVSTVQHYFF